MNDVGNTDTIIDHVNNLDSIGRIDTWLEVWQMIMIINTINETCGKLKVDARFLFSNITMTLLHTYVLFVADVFLTIC